MQTRIVTASVPLDLAERVEELATSVGQSPAWVLEQALSAWIDQDEQRHRLTLAALSDVDVGAVVDHRVVQAWADGLDDAPDPAMPSI